MSLADQGRIKRLFWFPLLAGFVVAGCTVQGLPRWNELANARGPVEIRQIVFPESRILRAGSQQRFGFVDVSFPATGSPGAEGSTRTLKVVGGSDVYIQQIRIYPLACARVDIPGIQENCEISMLGPGPAVFGFDPYQPRCSLVLKGFPSPVRIPCPTDLEIGK